MALPYTVTRPEDVRLSPQGMTGARAASASQDKEVSGRGAPGGGGSPRTGPSGPEVRLETTGDGGNRWPNSSRPQ